MMLCFFQAEDGIRDVAVTGVQTCALPISGWAITWLAASESTAASREAPAGTVTVTGGPSGRPQAAAVATNRMRSAECGMRNGSGDRRGGGAALAVDLPPPIPHFALPPSHLFTSPIPPLRSE